MGTKRSLFLAVVHDAFQRCRTALGATADAIGPATPERKPKALGETYRGLAADRDLLGLQLQAQAACDDPEIRAVVRQEWATLREAIRCWSGADAAALHAWFAELTLMIVAVTVGGLTTGMHGLCPVVTGRTAAASDGTGPASG